MRRVVHGVVHSVVYGVTQGVVDGVWRESGVGSVLQLSVQLRLGEQVGKLLNLIRN